MELKDEILSAIEIMVDGHEKVLLTRYAKLTEFNKEACQFILDRDVSFMNNGGVMKAINFLTLSNILDAVKDIKSMLTELNSNKKELGGYQPNHTVISETVKKDDVNAILESLKVKK